MAFCKTLRDNANDIEKCANDVASTPGMRSVLIHKTTMSKKHLPALWDWLVTVEKDVKSQIKAFKAGVKSKAQLEVERAAARSSKSLVESSDESQEAVTKKSDRKGRKETKGQ